MNQSALRLGGLGKRFAPDNRWVLENLNIEIPAGEFLAVLGSSGSGKTTLLRLIAGFDSPTAGEIEIFGKKVATDQTFIPAEARKVGFVPQDASLFPHLNVFENVAFGLAGLSKQAKISRVRELLDLVAMTEFENHDSVSLSGGQKHRIAIARALAPEPELILLDEPFAALDAELRVRLRHEIRQVLDKVSATTILVTHDQEEALSMADRVALLRDGNFAQIGNPREIYSSPVDLGVATFLGDSVIVDGVIEGGKVQTSLGQLTPLNSAKDGSRGKVAIRPENFYLQPNLNGDSVVVGRQFFGHDAVVEVKTPGQIIRARSSGPFAPEIGMKVTVWVRGAVNFYPN
ncbi:MAG: ABC transporter ATP-binding protein [Actinomycetota bacterium]